MAKGFYQYYKDLPSWAKGVVVVGGGVVAYLAVTTIMRKIKQAKETAVCETRWVRGRRSNSPSY